MSIGIIIILLCFFSVVYYFANKSSSKKYGRSLFTRAQTILLCLSICSTLGYIILSKFGTVTTLNTNILLGLSILLGVVSAGVGIKGTGPFIGVIIFIYTVTVIPVGAIILYGLGRAIIFVAPTVAIIWFMKDFLSRKSR